MKPQNTLISRDRQTQIQGWVREAGDYAIKKQPDVSIFIKENQTPVTSLELIIEHNLITKILNTYPDHQVLSEENGIIGSSSEYLWVLDPIDGTKQYICGLPFWGLSLGLLYNLKPILGFVYLPKVQKFYSGDSEKIYLNNRKWLSHHPTDLHENLKFLAISSNSHSRFNIRYPRIRAFGSIVFHLSCLLQGMAVGVLTRPIHLWDIAGFLPFFEHEHISIRQISGQPLDYVAIISGEKTSQELIIAPENSIEHLLDLISIKNGEI